jgi:thioredoxin-like negative regulator of GroEL
MNALLFLNTTDFELNGDELFCRKADGLMMVLFYSNGCPHCGPARNVFNSVASQFMQGKCKFGLINISQNPKVPQLARNSKTPIRFVPFILAFFNGRPLVPFGSQITPQTLVQFVQQCFGSIQDKVDAFGAVKKDDEIPAYTVGVPVCEDGVCYLSFDDAYQK